LKIKIGLLLLIVISDLFYKMNRTQWPNLLAAIDGRSGVVVSHWPFDLRITINTKNSETENREWITDWRWNFELLEKDAYRP